MAEMSKQHAIQRLAPKLFTALGVLLAIAMLVIPPFVTFTETGGRARCEPLINVAPVEVSSNYYTADQGGRDALWAEIKSATAYDIVGVDDAGILEAYMAYGIGCEQSRTNMLTILVVGGVLWAYGAYRWFRWSRRVYGELTE